MSDSKDLMLTVSQQITESLSAHHPLAGLLGEVFEELGGKAFISEWAEDNPTKFIGLMFQQLPSAAPVTGYTGEVNITINQSLQPTDLDKTNLDEQGRVIHD